MRRRLRCRPAAQTSPFDIDKQGVTGLETGERTPFCGPAGLEETAPGGASPAVENRGPAVIADTSGKSGTAAPAGRRAAAERLRQA